MDRRVVMSKRLVRDGEDSKPYLLADALALDESYKSLGKAGFASRERITLDLSELDYLDHDSLLYLGALLRFRANQRRSTLIDLPEEDHVWQFMRAWSFPDFIAAVSGKPFDDMLTERSRARFLRDKDTYPTYVTVIRLPGGGLEELLPTDHFRITPIQLSENPLRAATLAQSSWLERHTLSILDAYLNDEGSRVGSLVVLEAVLNAAMHPEATMAFTSSQVVLPSRAEASERPILQIAVWDDGLPLATTLKRRIDSGGHVTSPAFDAFEESFEVRLIRSSGREELRLLDSGRHEIPTEFPWLTVAAFMAGVTSLPDRDPSLTGDAVRGADSGSRFPGMGLRYIRRNVLDLWGGRIRYWTNNYRLSMRSLPEPDHYSVTIYYRPKSAWPLEGNLFYLDIPLGSDVASESDDV